MADKLGDGGSGGDVPQTAGSVPGGGEAEARVAGQLNFGHEVRVTSVHLLGSTPFLVLILVSLHVDFPLNEGLIARS